MTLFRCDGCARTEESPRGFTPDYWFRQVCRFRANGTPAPMHLGEYVDVDETKTRVVHACSTMCVAAARTAAFAGALVAAAAER